MCPRQSLVSQATDRKNTITSPTDGRDWCKAGSTRAIDAKLPSSQPGTRGGVQCCKDDDLVDAECALMGQTDLALCLEVYDQGGHSPRPTVLVIKPAKRRSFAAACASCPDDATRG